MNGDAQRRLESVLDRELEAAASLAAALAAERSALTGDSPQAVLDNAAQKTTLFARIEALESERRDLCDTEHVALPRLTHGRTPLLVGVPESVAERWRALLEMIAGCRLANELNGYIINARRGQINQLFNVLRGGSPITYGPQGKTFANSLRALARA